MSSKSCLEALEVDHLEHLRDTLNAGGDSSRALSSAASCLALEAANIDRVFALEMLTMAEEADNDLGQPF